MSIQRIKVGQKWKTRAEKFVVVIKEDDASYTYYPFTVFDGEDTYTVTMNGGKFTDRIDLDDLIELVEESLNAPPQVQTASYKQGFQDGREFAEKTIALEIAQLAQRLSLVFAPYGISFTADSQR